MMRRLVTAMLLVFPVLAGTDSHGENQKTLTVCEVIQNLESLNGKTVAIRGELYSGDHESLLLPAETCPEERRRDGYIWHPRIHLVDASEQDRQALRATKKQMVAAFGGEPYWKFKVIITYVGRLSTKWNEVYPMPDGSFRGGGFGFADASPAELRIVTGRDVEVSRFREDDEPKEKK